MPPQSAGPKKNWKERAEVRRSSSRKPESVKSPSNLSDLQRTSSSKSVPQRRQSLTSPNEFHAKVSCWQQRIDPDSEVNISKKRKQRPVSIAGDANSISLKQYGSMKRSLSSHSLAEDGVNQY